MGWGMKQLTLSSTGFERYAKTTRQAVFLAEMDRVVPWSALCALIEPFYPKPGNGRPPVGGGTHAAHLFCAAVVQPVGPGGGGCALRFAGDAPVCRRRPRTRTSARRDHDVPLPPSAGGARSGPPAVRRGAAAPGGQGTE